MASSRLFRTSRVVSIRVSLIAFLVVFFAEWAQKDAFAADGQQAAGGETGRYFALVIGIDKYPPPIPQLHTAVSDARAVANVLEKQYGFQVALLTDAGATRTRILDQIAAYQSQLSADDNLLIYYAGHGFRIEEVSKSFWLPVDATSKQSSNRISADDLTTEMATSKARHVLVISDSCYSGGLTRDLTSVSDIKPNDAFLRKTLAMKSRNVMASGRDEPVADGGPEGHSVFAWALLQALTTQTASLFTASDLFYSHVQRAAAGHSDQVPVYLPIRNSGDIGGDFVFRRFTTTRSEVESRLSAAPAGFDRGNALLTSRDYTGAASAFSESCTYGDLRGCTNLGYMYEWGFSFPKDYAQAAALYRRACDRGLSAGCVNLGSLYDRGLGLEQDYSQALTYYLRGCNEGYLPGCMDLGAMYRSGRGVTQDYTQAFSFYSKGCSDNGWGCSSLALMYATGEGAAPDLAKALALLQKGCDVNDGLSCSNLGIIYQDGQAVQKDYLRAIPLLRKGCEANAAMGCSDLGKMYEEGLGVTKDLAQAAALYRKGCEANDELGCSSLQKLQKLPYPQ